MYAHIITRVRGRERECATDLTKMEFSSAIWREEDPLNTHSICGIGTVQISHSANKDHLQKRSSSISEMSDFSIEYILNRAGDKYSGTNGSMGIARREKSPHFHPYHNLSLDNREVEQQKYELLPGFQTNHQAQQFLEQFPVLDWLQYTRYHPPKLQSKLKTLSKNGKCKIINKYIFLLLFVLL